MPKHVPARRKGPMRNAASPGSALRKRCRPRVGGVVEGSGPRSRRTQSGAMGSNPIPSAEGPRGGHFAFLEMLYLWAFCGFGASLLFMSAEAKPAKVLFWPDPTCCGVADQWIWFLPSGRERIRHRAEAGFGQVGAIHPARRCACGVRNRGGAPGGSGPLPVPRSGNGRLFPRGRLSSRRSLRGRPGLLR